MTGIVVVMAAETQKEAAERYRCDPVIQKIEGWTVHAEPGPFHPDAGWLTERGYDPRLARKFT